MSKHINCAKFVSSRLMHFRKLHLLLCFDFKIYICADYRKMRIQVVCRSQRQPCCPKSHHRLCHIFLQNTPPPCLWLVHLLCSMHHHSHQPSVSQWHQYRMLQGDKVDSMYSILVTNEREFRLHYDLHT